MSDKIPITEGMSPALRARQEKRRAGKEFATGIMETLIPELEQAARVREELQKLAVETGKTDIRSGYQQLSHVFGGAIASVNLNARVGMIAATVNNIDGAIERIETVQEVYAADLKGIELEANPAQIMKDIQEKLRPHISSPHAIVF